MKLLGIVAGLLACGPAVAQDIVITIRQGSAPPVTYSTAPVPVIRYGVPAVAWPAPVVASWPVLPAVRYVPAAPVYLSSPSRMPTTVERRYGLFGGLRSERMTTGGG